MSSVSDSLRAANAAIEAASTLLSAQTYEYALTKPLRKGGAPSGYTGQRPPKTRWTWKYRHGVVQYDRPLSEDTILRHGLVPLTPDDPAVLDLAQSLFYDDIMFQLIRLDEFQTGLGNGRVAVVKHSRAGDYDIEFFDRIGNVAGKPLRVKKVRDAATKLWPFLSQSERRSFLDVALVDI